MDTSVLLGYTAELQCKVSNDPSVLYDIAWFHNSQYVHFYINDINDINDNKNGYSTFVAFAE